MATGSVEASWQVNRFYTRPLTVDVGGLPVHYRRKGEGEPVLFLHGAGFTRMWLPMYEELSQSVDFIAPEQPGMGETPAQEGLSSFSDLAMLYDDFLDAIGVDRIHLVGYSGGGWLAAEYASYFHRRLKSLTLLTPVGLEVPNHPVANIFEMPPAQVFSNLFHRGGGYEDYLPNPSRPHEIAAAQQEMASLKGLMGSPFRYNPKLPQKLGQVECPALVIAAEHDRLIPKAVINAYADALGASVATVSNVGHGLVVEEPIGVAAAIFDLVNKSSQKSQ